MLDLEKQCLVYMSRTAEPPIFNATVFDLRLMARQHRAIVEKIVQTIKYNSFISLSKYWSFYRLPTLTDYHSTEEKQTFLKITKLAPINYRLQTILEYNESCPTMTRRYTFAGVNWRKQHYNRGAMHTKSTQCIPQLATTPSCVGWQQ